MDGKPGPGAADAAFFSGLPAETRFFLLRHGQSEGNARGLIQGRRDYPLDAAGRVQAAAAGAWLAAEGTGAVLASPLARAAETAAIVAAACGAAGPLLDPAFIELETGIFSGLSLDEARVRHPEAYDCFERASWDGVPGAESSGELYGRAMAAWEILRAAAFGEGRSLVCVTHAGFIQWLVRATFGCRSWMPLFPTGNCGLFELFAAPSSPGEPAYLQWKRLNFLPAAGSAAAAPSA